MSKETLYWDDIEEASEVTPLPKNASSQLLVKYAGASGDFYQIHYDVEFAKVASIELWMYQMKIWFVKVS